VKGLPRYVLTRGQVAVDDGAVKTQEGHGQFVGREARPAVNRALSQWKDLTAPRPVVRTGVPATGV
jgi:dihydropyrimidinase